MKFERKAFDFQGSFLSVPPLKTLHESLLIPLWWAFAGFRQIGKTTLAKVLASSFRPAAVYLDVELPSDLARLEEPELYLTPLHDRLVIIPDYALQMPEKSNFIKLLPS